MADDLKPIKKMQIINEGVTSDRYIGADSQDITVYKKDGEIVSRDTPDAEETNLNAILSNIATDGQEQIQFEVMPEPSIDYQGKIYQYIGTNTSSGYTTGSFYQCVLQQSTGQYIWKPLSSSVTFNQRAGGANNVTNEAATPNALFQTMQKFDEDYIEDGNIVVDIIHGGTGTNDGTINGVKLGVEENVYGYYDANGNFKSFRQPTGNATAGDVLRGKTFANANNDSIEGEMDDRGAVSQSLNCGGSYVIPKGYHNGGGRVTANSLASQTSANANASQILYPQTAWVNGSKITGSMSNRGAWNPGLTPRNGGNATIGIPAGYYSGGTITAYGAADYNDGYAQAKVTANQHMNNVYNTIMTNLTNVGNRSVNRTGDTWRVKDQNDVAAFLDTVSAAVIALKQALANM